MEIIRNSTLSHIAILGEPHVNVNVKYRWMKFLVTSEVEGGIVILNGLTRSVVHIKTEEFADIEDIKNADFYKYLYKQYYLVPEDFDEYTQLLNIRSKFNPKVDDLYLLHPDTFTILSTTRCNARCFYCYELRMKAKKHMSEETAYKVANYIDRVAYKDVVVELAWFGGEPLFNMKVIDIVSNELNKKGRPFKTRMTTNGYLFDLDLILKAKYLWHLHTVQITLDGTRDVYNKAKNYIYKKELNPYGRVLNNIGILIDNNINVELRLNVDTYNGENMKDLIKEVHSRFSNHPCLHIYSHLLFEDESKTEEERILSYKALDEVEDELIKHGYDISFPIIDYVLDCQCMADDDRSVMIGVDGELGVCEHRVDNDFFGHIDSEERNLQILKDWHEYEYHGCENCPLAGDCLRPKKCEELVKCDEHLKLDRLKLISLGLEKMFNLYKANINGN